MIVLGINAFGHDAAAVLLVDGHPAYAVGQERLDRRRHSAAFPLEAMQAAFDATGVRPGEVDAVAFPWLRGMARWRKSWHVLRGLPSTLAYFRETPDPDVPSRLGYLSAMRGLERHLGRLGFRAPVHRVAHHEAHAASAALALPEASGAVLTADGMGEWTTAAAWAVDGGQPRMLREARYPHSPGKTYAALTQWLGFRPESDEGKTMGLAAYGDPRSPAAAATRGWLDHDPRTLVRVDLRHLAFPHGASTLYGDAVLRALGPARRPGQPLDATHRDAARGLQDAVESAMAEAARQLLAETGAAHLALAGGLFLNCALNGHLARTLPVPVHPFPVAGDAGAAWGAAALVHRQRTGRPAAPLESLRLGRAITDDDARAVAEAPALPLDDLAADVARRIGRGELVAVARGRAEFGPRALGGRSILASASSTRHRDRLNEHKGREPWRPLAPVVRQEETRYFVDLAPSPSMILTFRATEEGRRRIPGGIHADGTARVQTVGPGDDPFLRVLLDALEGMGEPPACLNTSLNRPGEPIVDTAEQAAVAARAMRLDALVVANRLQPL